MTRVGHRRALVTLLGLTLVVASCAAEVAPSLTPSTPESVEYGHFPPVPTATLAPTLADELQDVLDKAIAGGTTSAIAAAVIVPGIGTWAGAAGEGLDGEPLPVEAQFFIASVTKTVVAAQVLQLVEQDRIDLDAPLTDYLPPDVAIDSNGATVRQALSMRSGLAELSNDVSAPVSDEPARQWTLGDLAEFAQEPLFQPGQVFHYNNVNYILLGAAIEFVTEQPLAEVLRSGVLAHPGLGGLIFQDAERPRGSIAPPTASEGFPSARAAIDAAGGYLPSRAVVTAIGGAGAMASDAPSLARWAYLLYGGYVLEPSSLAAMIDTGDRYGLGAFPVEQNGLHGVGHDGWLAGYRSLAYADRETGTVIVVLVNAETHAPIATAAQLLRIVGD